MQVNIYICIGYVPLTSHFICSGDPIWVLKRGGLETSVKLCIPKIAKLRG